MIHTEEQSYLNKTAAILAQLSLLIKTKFKEHSNSIEWRVSVY